MRALQWLLACAFGPHRTGTRLDVHAPQACAPVALRGASVAQLVAPMVIQYVLPRAVTPFAIADLLHRALGRFPFLATKPARDRDVLLPHPALLVHRSVEHVAPRDTFAEESPFLGRAETKWRTAWRLARRLDEPSLVVEMETAAASETLLQFSFNHACVDGALAVEFLRWVGALSRGEAPRAPPRADDDLLARECAAAAAATDAAAARECERARHDLVRVEDCGDDPWLAGARACRAFLRAHAWPRVTVFVLVDARHLFSELKGVGGVLFHALRVCTVADDDGDTDVHHLAARLRDAHATQSKALRLRDVLAAHACTRARTWTGSMLARGDADAPALQLNFVTGVMTLRATFDGGPDVLPTWRWPRARQTLAEAARAAPKETRTWVLRLGKPVDEDAFVGDLVTIA
jgi:hypothetical protein